MFKTLKATIKEAGSVTNYNERNDSNEDLQQLVAEACLYPAKSPERQRKLNKIVRVVNKSGKLWRGTEEDKPYYNDAITNTWIYMCQNLENYDPNRGASFITWYNSYLKWRLYDLKKNREWENLTRPIFRKDINGKKIPMSLEDISSEDGTIEPCSSSLTTLIKEIRGWVQTDSDGVLRNTIFRKRHEINAQVLILRRLEDIRWATITAEFRLNKADTQYLPQFFSRRCIPLLRKFCEQKGYKPKEKSKKKPKEKPEET